MPGLRSFRRGAAFAGSSFFCLHGDTQNALNQSAKTTISTRLIGRFHDGAGLFTDGAP
jgi:hypothetical protein